LDREQTVRVDMMRQTGFFPYTVLKSLEAHAIALPYEVQYLDIYGCLVLTFNPETVIPNLKHPATSGFQCIISIYTNLLKKSMEFQT
jgi:hypothetical protein